MGTWGLLIEKVIWFLCKEYGFIEITGRKKKKKKKERKRFPILVLLRRGR